VAGAVSAAAPRVQGAAARIAPADDRGRGATARGGTVGDADALVTTDPDTVLAVLVADCVPIVLYDPRAHVLACVHAGWRGSVAGVAGTALGTMAILGAKAQDVIAGIGPAIGPDRYQVGDEVAQAARETFGDRASLVLRPDGPGRWLFDLWAANRLILGDAGGSGQHIHLAAVPTGAGVFSDRAARPCGRFAAIARLRAR